MTLARMPSHFSCVGFPIEAPDQLEPLAQLAAESGQVFRAGDGAYVRWQAGAGVELWLQCDAEQTVIGVTPHFAGEARLRAGLVEAISRPGESPLDGGFSAIAGPKPDQVDGDTPFCFDAPDALRYHDLQLPTLVELQLAGFAHQWVGYASEGAYRQAQPEFRLSIGRFDELAAPEGAPANAPREAFARLTGVVRAAMGLKNPFSGHGFLWARLAIPGGEIDVVCDPELAMGVEVVPGSVLDGIFWLSGRVVRTL
jgi:hypothetical protein